VALKGGQHSAPLQPPTHRRLLRGVDPMRLEHALGDVRTDRGGLHGGRLLSSRGVVHPSATPLAHRCRRAGPSTASVRTALDGYPGVRARTTCISALSHRSPTRVASSRVRPGRVRVPSTMQGHPSCRSRRMRVRRWLTEKRGTTRRRSWRKLHLATDADTGRLVAAALTDKDADDGWGSAPCTTRSMVPSRPLPPTARTTAMTFTPRLRRGILTPASLSHPDRAWCRAT
jgi:hypothetical protein